MLDKGSGLDQPGINLGPAQGFAVTDFFITGFANTFVHPPAPPEAQRTGLDMTI